MSPILLFGLLLALSFGAVAWVLKPTRTESDVQRHLTTIGGMYTTDAQGATILRQEALSTIPWVNSLLKGIPRIANLRLLITQAGSNWSVGALTFGSVLATFVVAWVLTLFVPALLLAVIAGVAAGLIPYVYLYVKRAARFSRFDALLPEAIDLMSRALRAGHAVTSAIEMVSQEIAEPVASEFGIVFKEQNLGLPIREAIMGLVERVPLEDVRFLATAILVQKETGGNLAEVLDKTSAVMRERIRIRGQLRIYTAQGRVTGWVLCSLPFAVFLVINLVNHEYEKKLWTDPLGLHIVYAGLVMMAIGIYSIRKIIDLKV
jgi:tight adherence protein B